MGKQFNIDLALRGSDQGAGSAVDKLAMKLKVLKKESTASGEAGLERLLSKGPAGLAQGLGELLGVGKLGIATVILDQVAGGINKVTESLQGLHEGKKTWGELLENLIRAVPVIGGLIGALRDMRFELDGSYAADRKLTAATERATEALRNRAAEVSNLSGKIRTFNEELSKLRYDARHPDVDNSYTQRLDAEDARYAEQRKKLQEERNKANLIGGNVGDSMSMEIASQETEAERLHQAAIKKIFDDGTRDKKELLQKENDDLAKLQADHRAAELDALGRGLDAQLERVRQAGAEKLLELEKQRKEAIKSGLWDDTLENTLVQKKKALQQNVDDQVRDAVRKNDEQDRQEMLGRWNDLQAQKAPPPRMPFQAELLSARYQGTAHQQDPVAQKLETTNQILREVRDWMRKESVGDIPQARGIALRA